MIRNLPQGHRNGTWTFYDWQSSRQSIPDRFAEVARRFPDRPATYDTARQLTYVELERAANRVAHAILEARGPNQEAVIILTGINTTATIAALGVLKTNKFYVGLDPAFPAVRAGQIIQDTEAKLILTETFHLPLARTLGGGKCRIIDLDTFPAGDERKPDTTVPAESIAIINYTSGTTGQPKGVVHTHRSALAQAVRYGNAYRLSDVDRMTSFGSLAWAGSFWDTFGPLCLGACVASYDVKRLGMQTLIGWLRETGVTVMSGMAVTCGLARGFPELRLPEVRLIQLGGDTIYRRDVEACQRVFFNAVIAAGLGMSEAGRVAEIFLPPGEKLGYEIAPVGYPVPGVRILLLSEDGNEVSAGEVGEIAVQGDYLAQGYWRRPELTELKFRRHPQGGSDRVYFSGDLGRQLNDGIFQHMGRKDFQVKIRGYQVPAHEVESRLLDIEGVRDVCVTARSLSDGSQELVAYLVADQDHSFTVERLRSRLVDRLPDHMVPHRFIHMDRLPRTLNGKVDRHALPDRNSARPRLETEYVAPRTPFEAALGTIWSEVLGIDRVGIHDDFLSLGGDSLRAAQVLSRVEHEFGVALSFELLLMGPTVAGLAIAITDRMMSHLPPEQIEAYLAGDAPATTESEPRRSRPAEQKQPGGSEGALESGRGDS